MVAEEQLKRGLHETVLDHLGTQLTSGEIPAGEVLRIEELAQRYEVGRSVIREAVRVLESMGMLTTRRRVGVTVADRAAWNVLDPRIIRWRLDGPDRQAQLTSLGELRAGVEPVAAALAARRATPEQCGIMTGAVMDMAVHGKSGDLEAYLEADLVFHRTLLAASGNEMLAALSGVTDEVLIGRTHHGLMPHNPNPPTAIVSGISGCDFTRRTSSCSAATWSSTTLNRCHDASTPAE